MARRVFSWKKVVGLSALGLTVAAVGGAGYAIRRAWNDLKDVAFFDPVQFDKEIENTHVVNWNLIKTVEAALVEPTHSTKVLYAPKGAGKSFATTVAVGRLSYEKKIGGSICIRRPHELIRHNSDEIEYGAFTIRLSELPHLSHTWLDGRTTVDNTADKPAVWIVDNPRFADVDPLVCDLAKAGAGKNVVPLVLTNDTFVRDTILNKVPHAKNISEHHPTWSRTQLAALFDEEQAKLKKDVASHKNLILDVVQRLGSFPGTLKKVLWCLEVSDNPVAVCLAEMCDKP